MRLFISLFLVVFFGACNSQDSKEASGSSRETKSEEQQSAPEWAIVIHGGAGSMNPDYFSDEQEQAYRLSLDSALAIGEEILKNGGSSTDAVESTIQFMENSPLFNAGRGAVLTSEGHAEMDASIMEGKNRNCGAVTGIQNVKNPISAARKVMEESKHVFFSGQGATSFAKSQNLQMIDSSYFITEDTWNHYLKIKAEKEKDQSAVLPESFKFGTVGCVALDNNGNITAGTSTGGMMWKQHGRIGDSPVIGAGTYADNRSCGISCTGHGEYFIRAAVAHDISARMIHGGQSLEESATQVVMEELVEMGGDGGVIGIDHLGNIVMTFNTRGMFRGFSHAEGERGVYMFKDEEEKAN